MCAPHGRCTEEEEGKRRNIAAHILTSLRPHEIFERSSYGALPILPCDAGTFPDDTQRIRTSPWDLRCGWSCCGMIRWWNSLQALLVRCCTGSDAFPWTILTVNNPTASYDTGGWVRRRGPNNNAWSMGASGSVCSMEQKVVSRIFQLRSTH